MSITATIFLGLKLVSIIFIFTSKASPLKTIKKSFFVSSKELIFFASFPHFSDSKGQMKVEYLCHKLGWIYIVADIIFGITQKSLYVTSSNIVR